MATASYLNINYRVRHAKSIERKMLCDALLRLSFFEPIQNYRYVGFGSTTFTDFILFHKVLGIRDMISIEKNKRDKARFEFNNPFGCICIKYGNSNKVLPSLAWDIKTIVWLDYDGRLTNRVLQDIAYASMNLVSGSVLVVTVNAMPDSLPDPRPSTEKEVQNYRLEQFRKRVGSHRVPHDVRGKNLEAGEMATTCGRVILNEIEETLRNRNGLRSRDRNGLRSPEREVEYKPLFNFLYQDNARMLTVGGIFYETGDRASLERCEFEKLDFVRSNAAFYEIEVPMLTHRECLYLDKKLPEGNSDAGKQIGLTEKDINNYKRLYRYFTTFAEIELS